MTYERWGSLAVDDHVDAHALVANILLYDRLIVPVMSSQADRDERAYWVNRGWEPDLQRRRLDELGDLAIGRPWDARRRQIFRTRAEELHAERGDAADADNKQLTRMILAQEGAIEKPPGVHGVTVVAAYNSATALRRDFQISASEPVAAQAFLLSRRFAVPDVADPEDSLKAAMDLSRDTEFRKKRRDLFDWQELAIAGGWRPDQVVERIVEMSDAYNAAVTEAVHTVRWKFAFTLFGIGLGFATGGALAAGAAAALSLVQFGFLDRKPAVAAGSAAPAAMFHDVEDALGLHLL